MKKKILKITIVALIVASVLGNVYYFGWKRIEQKIYERAVQNTINAILFQVQNTGQVIINLEGEQVILVPQ